jgi:hypothetical protein
MTAETGSSGRVRSALVVRTDDITQVRVPLFGGCLTTRRKAKP